ncbi:MAG: extracellular solute-binding protein [Chloroflexota bacterium]
MNKNSTLRCLSLLLVLAILVGCAKPTPTPVPAKPTAVPDKPTAVPAPEEHEKVVLTFIRPGMGDDAMKEVEAQMAPFYEKYPWIELETLVVAPPELGPKLMTAVAGGEPPDLCMISPSDYLHFARNGQLLDLTPFAEAEGWDWKNYYSESTVDFLSIDGKLYGMSASVEVRGLAYNKDMFDAAGMAYPDDTWTWDDMLAAAQKLTLDTDGDGEIDQWGFGNIHWDYQPWIWAAGAELFNEDFTEVLTDDPKVVEVFQWLADLRFKYKVCPTWEVSQAYPGDGIPFMFQEGLLAMYTTRWIPDVAFFFGRQEDLNYDVAPLPVHSQTGLRIAGSGGILNAVFAATKHPEEAYLVWKWMTTDEGVYARSVGLTGIPMIPNAKNPDDWPMLAGAFRELERPEHAEIFLDALAYTRSTGLPIPNAREFYNAIDPYLDELWLGTMTAAEAAPLIKEAGDAVLQGGEPAKVTQKPTAVPAPEEHEKVVLTYIRPGVGGDAQAETDAQMLAFHEQYPWIELETLVVAPPELGPKLLTAVAGGEPPDICMVNGSDFLHFARNGQLLDLTPFAEAEGWDWKNYYSPAYVDYLSVEGKLYGMPESIMNKALAYNKDMFDAAGLAYPDDTWTWDDLLEAAKKLTLDTDGDGEIDQWGISNRPFDYFPWIWSAGVELLNEDYTEVLTDDPKVVEVFQWLADLTHKHKVHPPAEVAEAFPFRQGGVFMMGKAAMHVINYLLVGMIIPKMAPDLNYDVAQFPMHPETGLRGSCSGGPLPAVFAATEHPEEAYLLWRFLSSDAGGYARSVGIGGLPVVPNAKNLDDWPMLTNAMRAVQSPEHIEVFMEALAYDRIVDLPIPNAREFYAAIDPYLDELWLGTMTAAEAAPLIKEAGDAVLQSQD